jgi:hypothetical protein
MPIDAGCTVYIANGTERLLKSPQRQIDTALMDSAISERQGVLPFPIEKLPHPRSVLSPTVLEADATTHETTRFLPDVCLVDHEMYRTTGRSWKYTP